MNSSCAVGAGQHDERALGAGDLDRRVEHERQHFLQDAARSQRAEALEQRRDLAQVVARAGASTGATGCDPRRPTGTPGRRRRPGPSRIRSPDRSSHSVTGSPLTNVPYRDALSRSRYLPPSQRDFGVLARHLAAAEAQVVGLAAADGERHPIERDDALAEHVADFQPRASA